jgi:hypothetical protein
MIAPPDGEPDFEVELPVCRCAAPADLAEELQTRFEQRGQRVRCDTGAHPRSLVTLTVSQVQFFQVKRLAPARRRGQMSTQPDMIILDDLVGLTTVLSTTTVEWRAVVDAKRPTIASTWMPIFDVRTLVRTGVELDVVSEADADRQLPPLALALGMDRDEITIKPPPGWCGYGHPELFPRTPGRR